MGAMPGRAGASGRSDPGPTGAADEADIVDVFTEVVDAAEVLDELPDAARVVTWASSVLSVWSEDPDAASIDREFLAWLAASDHPRARLVLASLAGVADVDPTALRGAQDTGDPPPPWFGQLDRAEATRAWTVRDRASVSIGIGIRLGDGSELSLLADVVDGVLASIVAAPGPDELFDGSEDLIAPEPLAVEAAARSVVDAWRALVAGDGPIPETVHVNGALAARRLGAIVGTDLTSLFRAEPTIEDSDRAVDTQERAESNRWALSVLDGAGVGVGSPGPPVLLDPLVPERIIGYPAAEREAFEALEWADWLGAVLGLVRAPSGTGVDPSVLVDLVNRCPEVTSSIPKRDRPYYEWAFSMVLPIWRAAGVVDESGQLSDSGGAHLVAALREAWS